MRILTDVTRFKKRNLVSGPIWIEFSDHSFPLEEWYDFPVVILSWWIEAFLSVLRGEATTAECWFMDGPYFFSLTKAGNEHLGIETFRREEPSNTLFGRGSAPIRFIGDELLKAGEAVDICSQHRGWETMDLQTLQRLIQELREAK